MEMSYEVFLEMVEETLIKYFPEKYQSWEVMIKRKAKVNGIGDTILLKGDRSFGALPAIYVQDMYQAYQAGCPIPAVMQKCATVLADALDAKTERDPILDAALDAIRNPNEKVVFQLINTEKNEELLKSVPHRSFLDISIVYYLEVTGGRIRIDYTLAERIEYTEEKLYQAAMKNSCKIKPYVLDTMRNTILKLLDIPWLDDMSEEEKNGVLSGLGVGEEQTPMWYLSNVDGYYGITGILYEDVLVEIASVVGGDYYVIPSSIHEGIIIRVNDIDLEDAMRLHGNIGNEENLNEGEHLSDQVYVYHLSTGRLEIAK